MNGFLADLGEPQEWDTALYRLGCRLGVFDPEADSSVYKADLWSANPVSDMLTKMLFDMRDLRILLYDDEEQAYLRNPEFDILIGVNTKRIPGHTERMKAHFLAEIPDWEDADIAAHLLALHLGIADESVGNFQVTYKWLYWTDNPVGKMLYGFLEALQNGGFLEHDEEEGGYRAVRALGLCDLEGDR